MSEPKFTPGPWTAVAPYGAGRWGINSPTNAHGEFVLIAEAHDRDNAALIAAAPRLYAALAAVHGAYLRSQRLEDLGIAVAALGQTIADDLSKARGGT